MWIGCCDITCCYSGAGDIFVVGYEGSWRHIIWLGFDEWLEVDWIFVVTYI